MPLLTSRDSLSRKIAMYKDHGDRPRLSPSVYVYKYSLRVPIFTVMRSKSNIPCARSEQPSERYMASGSEPT